MARVERWTGVESHALQQALALSAEDFAAQVEVNTSMIYRWRRAGPDAQLRVRNQRRLAELLDGLDEGRQQRFGDLLAVEWERWHGPGGQPITSALVPAALAGYWVTSYQFGDDRSHADIAYIGAPGGRVITAKNWPPEPRSQGRKMGFRNQIEGELFDRHLIGRWRNVSDNYYFGSLHLAVLPGEDVLDGIYTGFAHDSTNPTARQWKWVRLEKPSVEGIDLTAITLREPQAVYSVLGTHTYADGPLPLSDVVEAR